MWPNNTNDDIEKNLQYDDGGDYWANYYYDYYHDFNVDTDSSDADTDDGDVD